MVKVIVLVVAVFNRGLLILVLECGGHYDIYIP
jgi:hypothetical protein